MMNTHACKKKMQINKWRERDRLGSKGRESEKNKDGVRMRDVKTDQDVEK